MNELITRLRACASQENCDSEEYDLMIKAADALENQNKQLKELINQFDAVDIDSNAKTMWGLKFYHAYDIDNILASYKAKNSETK